MGITAEIYEAIVKIVDDRMREIKITREDFSALKSVVEELAQAQKRTEIALQNLAQQVGRLSDTIGYGLEDVAKVMLPAYLERHYKISLKGPLGEELARRFFQIDTTEIEVNLYGEGEEPNGERIFVICECKSRIHKREVEEFEQTYKILLDFLTKQGKVFPVLFGFWIHPTAIEYGKEKNILLVASYQR